MAIRPIIIVQTNPMVIAKGGLLTVSARLFNPVTNIPQEVSRIFMQIISQTDGHTVWPLEVVRRDSAGFDILIGTDEMKEDHNYLVRVSNNWNMSPNGSTIFSVKKKDSTIPIGLFPPFLPEREPDDIDKREVEKYIFRTQMDHRVCPECKKYEDDEFEPNETKPTIPIHLNCLLPDTSVQIPDGIIGGVRTWYDGPVIELLTSKGTSLTVTPNHLFLTPQGFVAADFLREGDKVINRLGSQRKMNGVNPNDDGKPTTIQQVFDSLVESGSMMTMSVPSSPEYLHSDAMFGKGNIDIVRSNSLLMNDSESLFNEHICTHSLNGGNSNLVSLTSQSPEKLLLFSMLSPRSRNMSGMRQTEPFFSTRLRHTQKHGFASPSRNYTSTPQSAYNSSSGNPKTIRECLDRFSHVVEPDNIISINVKTFAGHVYDLQTPSTLYFGNNILLSNCRCTYDVIFRQIVSKQLEASFNEMFTVYRTAKRYREEREKSDMLKLIEVVSRLE